MLGDLYWRSRMLRGLYLALLGAAIAGSTYVAQYIGYVLVLPSHRTVPRFAQWHADTWPGGLAASICIGIALPWILKNRLFPGSRNRRRGNATESSEPSCGDG
jgi:hypothetical protein